jgi:hypothetical protein
MTRIPSKPTAVARKLEELARGETSRADEKKMVELLESLAPQQRGDAVRLVEGASQRGRAGWSLVDDFSEPGLRKRAEQLIGEARPFTATEGRFVISDIDDTVTREHDPDVVSGARVYPGAVAFYRALDAGLSGDDVAGDVHFVTARDGFFTRAEETLARTGIEYGSVSYGAVVSGALSKLGSYDGIAAEKLEDMRRLLARNPSRKAVLLGDSVQADPKVFRTLLHEQPGRIEAVFLHRVEGYPVPADVAAHPSVIVFSDYADAARQAHARGLISAAQLAAVLEDAAPGRT